MKNENFRNFNVCSKATASQKKIYSEKAKKAGISLSEWIVSVLDMYIEQETEKEMKKIQRKYEPKDKAISIFFEKLVHYPRRKIQSKTKEVILNSRMNNIALQNEIQQYNSVSKSLNTIGVVALLGTILLKR
jgi:predicted ATPase with chaperone activity